MNFEKVKAAIDEVKKELKDGFSSHHFIEKYAWLNEEEYVEMLYQHKANKPFRTVHATMAGFLSEHADELGIQKTERKESINIFGHETEVQWWE